MMSKIFSQILLIPILGYRYLISPLTGPRCRFVPTCSTYALEAIRVHGPAKGGWLTLCRLWRCRPFGPHGYDPVPPADCGHRHAVHKRGS
jgi:putative membrane protein insertion efficiency factor